MVERGAISSKTMFPAQNLRHFIEFFGSRFFFFFRKIFQKKICLRQKLFPSRSARLWMPCYKNVKKYKKGTFSDPNPPFSVKIVCSNFFIFDRLFDPHTPKMTKKTENFSQKSDFFYFFIFLPHETARRLASMSNEKIWFA